MIVRCTRKLAVEIGLRPQDLSQSSAAPHFFEDWHANLLRIDHRKCLLLTDSKTLFTFLVPGIRRRDLIRFRDLLRAHLAETLFSHSIDLTLVPALREISGVVFARTNDRRVLGSMNEYASLYKCYIADMGGLRYTDIRELNKKMNETPMGTLRYDSAVEAVKRELQELATCRGQR